MIKVEFLGPIGQEPIEIEAVSLQELSSKLKTYEQIAPWLEKCAVAINDEMVCQIDTPLKDGDRVSILPPVCGG
ncbi:MAG: MoaD/ThiS family protein [Campylobacterales bacterium]|nr:MoaD/ThiS family protein [Campylobacterales bacterium]